MVNKKSKEYREKQREKREKRKIQIEKDNEENSKRNEAERQIEVLNVIYRLKQNDFGTEYKAIKELLYKMNDYVKKGEKTEFSIPFPEKNKIIKGYLPIYKDEECVVVMKHND